MNRLTLCFSAVLFLFAATPFPLFAGEGELIRPKGPADARAIARPHIDYDAINKLGFRLGVQAWTFRNLSAFDTLDVLKALDIHYLEIYPGQRFSAEHHIPVGPALPQDLIDALLVKCRESDVTLTNFGVVGLSKNEADSRKVFEFAKKLGIQTIVSEPSPDKETFDTIDKLAVEYGVNVAIHDHPRGSSRYWNPEAVLAVCEGRSQRLGACCDVGHWLRSDLVPVDCVRKLQGRVISLHLKDLDKDKNDIPWGEGVVDARGIMAEVKRQGVKRPVFSIEYESSTGQQLIENVAKCCENFSKFAEELTAESK